MANALPTHPTLVHPITGAPLRAVFVSEKTGRVYWPILGGSPDPPAPPAPPTPPAPTPPAPPTPPEPPAPTPPADPGFPPNTPIEQMTPQQREAYWKHYARRHEDRLKALGNPTPEQLAEWKQKAEQHDALNDELATDKDKAVKQARKDAEAEAAAQYRPLLVRAEFARHVGDRLPDDALNSILDDFNLNNFLTSDGSVDTAKVKARAEQIAPARGSGGAKGPSGAGVGRQQSSQTGSARDKGAAEAARRFGSKQQQTA